MSEPRPFVVVAATLLSLLLPSAHLTAQTPPVAEQTERQIAAPPSTVLRTADGHPDIAGVWTFATATPLERPAMFTGQSVMTDEEAEDYLAQLRAARQARPGGALGLGAVQEFEQGARPFVTVGGRKPTALIVDPPDGRIPALTAEAQQRWSHYWTAQRADRPSDRLLPERCIRGDAGPPMLPNVSASPLEREVSSPYVRIIQTRQEIVFVQEGFDGARIVPLDGRAHVSDRIRLWLGDSRGRWNGDTLIVDTTNFRDQAQQRRASNRFDRNLHVLERLSVIDRDLLWYEFHSRRPDHV